MGVAGRGGAGVRASEEGGEVPGRRRDNGVSAGVGREGEKQWRGRQLEEEFFRRNLINYVFPWKHMFEGSGEWGVRGIIRAKTGSKQGQNNAKTEPAVATLYVWNWDSALPVEIPRWW